MQSGGPEIPARPLRRPERTKRNLIRFTPRMPARTRLPSPLQIAKIERPTGVSWSHDPTASASTAKKRIDHGTCVPGIRTTPMFARPLRKPPIVSVGRITCAIRGEVSASRS
jgi:hypothetical protein